MSEPKRAGLLQLLRETSGSQFVIPVYQRNYMWRADREVRQYLSDLTRVMRGDYHNHFLGILIYLGNELDYSARELSIIDGQQRMTTTFLTLYAVRALMKARHMDDDVLRLDGQYLTNPYSSVKIKYKLKPLVADDDVYRCIVEERLDDISNRKSTVFVNYEYILHYLTDLTEQGFTPNDILLAMDKLYLVCVPISEEDNAQKIFESINATGVKLTSADLIRNYLLMNLTSDVQDRFYKQYWRKIEALVSPDSKTLELFFRTYLAVKKYDLVPRNAVYRNFVDWVESEGAETESLFRELVNYAGIFHQIRDLALTEMPMELRIPLDDFRKIRSELPVSAVMGFWYLYQEESISAGQLASLIQSINSYLIRRSICDLDSQNISKLFPSVLKRVLEQCGGEYDGIVEIFNQILVGDNAGTSGSYMPTDAQMHDMLFHANVYKRPALRIILDRMELTDNPAPVDLSELSIEHLMPQTPTENWLKELDTDEETYMENLHRLGNLTLAAKSDNSRMSNLEWDYKNEVLKGTGHLKLNMSLLLVDRWDLQKIDERTETMIEDLCRLYPYPDVKPLLLQKDENIISEDEARKQTLHILERGLERTDSVYPSDPEHHSLIEVKKDSVFRTSDYSDGYVLRASKMYRSGERERYWFAYRGSLFDKIRNCKRLHFVLICRNHSIFIVDLPQSIMEKYQDNLNVSKDKDGNIVHYHVAIYKETDGTVNFLLSKPKLQKVNVSEYLMTENISQK